MLQKVLVSILGIMAWIEEVHPGGDARWSTLKGIFIGLTRDAHQADEAVASKQTCPECLGAGTPRPGTSNSHCPRCGGSGQV